MLDLPIDSTDTPVNMFSPCEAYDYDVHRKKETRTFSSIRFGGSVGSGFNVFAERKRVEEEGVPCAWGFPRRVILPF